MAVSQAENAIRLKLYQDGFSDQQIANRRNITLSAAHYWRKRRGLKCNHPDCRHLSPAEDAARLLLYQMRYSDRRIAREQRRTFSTIMIWRRNRGLKAHDLPCVHWTYESLCKDTTLDRIKAAIGRSLPPDIADDAIGELYLAVLSGVVNLDHVEREAKRYGNRVLGQFASKFGPRSLDEELGDEEGYRLIDNVRDERSSSWLEEMGATVW